MIVGDEADEERHGKDEVPGVRGLAQLAVEEGLDVEVGGIEAGGDARPDRGEGVERFGPGELLVLVLEVAGGDVVEAGVAQDVVGSTGRPRSGRDAVRPMTTASSPS